MNRRFLMECSLRVKMVKQNDGSSHGSQAEHVCLFSFKPLFVNHFLAYVSHTSQSSCNIVPWNAGVLHEGGKKMGVDGGRYR